MHKDNTVHMVEVHRDVAHKKAGSTARYVAVCYLGQHEHEPLQSSVHLQSGPQLQLAEEEEGEGSGQDVHSVEATIL